MANGHRHECIARLVDAGISYDDAVALRRISMTLRRWHELECGDGNDFASWTITRGFMVGKMFEHDDAGSPFEERHIYSRGTETPNRVIYSPIPDRETGAKRRLAKIMARYPALRAYIQTDPRGAALYIIRPGDVPEGSTVDSCYSRGLAVYK